MSKYIKLEDAIDGKCPVEDIWEDCIDCPLDNRADEPCKMGKWLKSLPTIEVSEDCENCKHENEPRFGTICGSCTKANSENFEPKVSEDAIRCYEFLKERIGSEITDNAEEFEKWFERMVFHVRKCNEYDSELRTVCEDAISREDAIKALRLEYPDMPLFKELRDEWHYEPKDEPKTQTETQNSNKNSNVISVYDGVSEAVRCAMCSNPNKSDRGCDGACSYDEKLYERIMKAIAESADTSQTETEGAE